MLIATFTNYGALETLKAVLAQTPAAFPTSLFAKLHIGDPGPDGLLNPAANTLRIVIPWNAAANIGGDGRAQAVSSAVATWDPVPTTETYTHVTLWDDVSVGNVWYFDALVTPVPVTAGGTFVFPIGQTIDHV